jgi:cytochrome c biogenesis factor
MLIYMNKAFNNFTLFTVNIFLILLLQKDLGLITNLDCLSRLDLNLSYFIGIYFLWTNIYFIYIYFITIILLIFTLLYSIRYSNYCFKVVAIVYSLSLLDIFTSAGSSVSLSNACSSNLANLLLLNTINKYHPFILYICFFSLVFHVFFSKPSAWLHKQFMAFFFKTKVLFLIFFTLYIGSWWAYQEGSWGGWWAWDPSESFGLVILLSILLLQHSNFRSKLFTHRKDLSVILLNLTLISYLILQTNFGITSHNFGLNNESNVFLKLNYIVLIIVSSTFIFAFFNKKIKVNNLLALGMQQLIIKLNYSYLITILIILFSFVPLLTSLGWKLFTINSFNFNIDFYSVIHILVVFAMIWYGLDCNFNALIFFFLVFSLNYVTPMSLIFFSLCTNIIFNRVLALHTLVLLFVYVCLLSSDYYVFSWDSTLSVSPTMYLKKALAHFNTECVKAPYLYSSLTNYLQETNNILISQETTSSNSLFNLSLKQSLISQSFLPDSDRLLFSSSLADNLSYTLIIILLSGLFSILSLFVNRASIKY